MRDAVAGGVGAGVVGAGVVGAGVVGAGVVGAGVVGAGVVGAGVVGAGVVGAGVVGAGVVGAGVVGAGVVGAGVVGAGVVGAGVVGAGAGVVGVAVGVVAVGFGVVVVGVGVGFVGVGVGVGLVGVGLGAGFALAASVVAVTGVPVVAVTPAVFVAALMPVVTALTSRVPNLRSAAIAAHCLCTMKRAASRHFASPVRYKAAPDGGMGALSAATTSADSFTAEAAFGRAGSREISRPTVSSARPPGPASQAGPAGVTDDVVVADAWAAPVMLAVRRAPPTIAVAPTDARCFLKVLLLCSVPAREEQDE